MVLIVPVNVGLSVFSEKHKATYSIGSETNVQNPGERRKTKGKQEKGVLWLWKIERVELLLFFSHWRGHQLMVNMSQGSIECQGSIMPI